MYIQENKKIILFLELMVINRTTTSTEEEEEETSFHFDGNAAAAAVCDSTSMDQRTCTSSHGQDLTSLYKIYIPLPALIVK